MHSTCSTGWPLFHLPAQMYRPPERTNGSLLSVTVSRGRTTSALFAVTIDRTAYALKGETVDSVLRRQFLQMLAMDFAALDLNDAGVRPWSGYRFEVTGPSYWPVLRAWWRGER